MSDTIERLLEVDETMIEIMMFRENFCMLSIDHFLQFQANSL